MRKAKRGLPKPPADDIQASREQAQAVVKALSGRQIDQLFSSRERAVDEYLLQRQTAIAQAKSGQITAELLAEQDEAAQIGERISWAMAPLIKVVDLAFKTLGWIWLGSGLLALGLAALSGGAPRDDSDTWTFSGLAGILFGVCVVTMALALGGLVASTFLRGLRKGRVRRALLNWAVDRPGQLARGLPGWDADSPLAAPPPGSTLLKIVKWVFGAIGAFGLGTGAVVLLIAVVTVDWDFARVMAIWVGCSAILAGAAWAIHRFVERADAVDAAADAGLVWVWQGRRVADSHSADD